MSDARWESMSVENRERLINKEYRRLMILGMLYAFNAIMTLWADKLGKDLREGIIKHRYKLSQWLNSDK